MVTLNDLMVKLNVKWYIVTYIQLSSDTSYDKIKHLVEIEDDIFAVFTINSRGEAYDLTVAKKLDFEKSVIENLFTNFNVIIKQDNDKILEILSDSNSDIVGKLKWKVTEYEKIRILQKTKRNSEKKRFSIFLLRLIFYILI